MAAPGATAEEQKRPRQEVRTVATAEEGQRSGETNGQCEVAAEIDREEGAEAERRERKEDRHGPTSLFVRLSFLFLLSIIV